MDKKAQGAILKAAVAVSFIAMVTVNALAQLLPINGVTPGQVSDSLPNLFAPAGLTFSIWSVIYLALAAFTVFQFSPGKQAADSSSIDRLRMLFVVSSLANIAWILTWHYGYIALSMVLMLLILASLAAANLFLDKRQMMRAEKICLRFPFSIYFGWITVATVANATSLLVKAGWGRFGLTEQLWAVVILLVAAAIGTLAMIIRKDIAYGLVLIWAYIGILIKHTTPVPGGFAGVYTAVIITVAVCLAVYAAAEAILILRRTRK